MFSATEADQEKTTSVGVKTCCQRREDDVSVLIRPQGPKTYVNIFTSGVECLSAQTKAKQNKGVEDARNFKSNVTR